MYSCMVNGASQWMPQSTLKQTARLEESLCIITTILYIIYHCSNCQSEIIYIHFYKNFCHQFDTKSIYTKYIYNTSVQLHIISMLITMYRHKYMNNVKKHVKWSPAPLFFSWHTKIVSELTSYIQKWQLVFYILFMIYKSNTCVFCLSTTV